MAKRLLLLPFLALLALASMGVGCKDPYGASEKAGLDIATSITGGMKTVDSLRVSGLITPVEETNILGYLEFANKADEAFVTCAQQAHTAGSKAGAYTACAQTFQTTLNNPTTLALIHVANSTASGEIQTIINGVNTGITAVITALGGQ